MFARLFAEAGLSLDRLRALVEVGAAGGIAKAVEADPTRQSQYSRQIKELEDFFQARLVERHGKGIRLTPAGRELARISRFFLLGLSNFHRGCLMEEQSFRIGGGAAFLECVLLPVLAGSGAAEKGPRYETEIATDTEIERRLHDLTLDFGAITAGTISRPLQMQAVGSWRLQLWAPRAGWRTEAKALRALREGRLPLAIASGEASLSGLEFLRECQPRLNCASFSGARAALEMGTAAALLPDFLSPPPTAKAFLQVRLPELAGVEFQYRLAWNPRLLRLNPHAGRQRDFLLEALAERMSGKRAG